MVLLMCALRVHVRKYYNKIFAFSVKKINIIKTYFLNKMDTIIAINKKNMIIVVNKIDMPVWCHLALVSPYIYF